MGDKDSTAGRLPKSGLGDSMEGKEVPDMYEIDNQKFGAFLVQLRKEKGLTQRELAEKLYVSDKAVSKWERGLSLPDIALLQPLAAMLDVNVTELLCGEMIPAGRTMTVEEVEPLVSGALSMNLTMSTQEMVDQKEHRKWWGKWFFVAVLACGLELWLLRGVEWLWGDELVFTILAPAMALGFGVYLVFFSKEKLPVFYDQYQLDFISDGVFRMNVPGVRFNNRNWPHILNGMRTWACLTLAGWVPLYCLLYLGLSLIFQNEWLRFMVLLPLVLFGIFAGLFMPVYILGKKYK